MHSFISFYFILFRTWHNKSINDDRNDDVYTSSPRFTQSLDLNSSDDVTIDGWWRHNNETIVPRSREILYLTILFTTIFTTGRVKKQMVGVQNVCIFTMPVGVTVQCRAIRASLNDSNELEPVN